MREIEINNDNNINVLERHNSQRPVSLRPSALPCHHGFPARCPFSRCQSHIPGESCPKTLTRNAFLIAVVDTSGRVHKINRKWFILRSRALNIHASRTKSNIVCEWTTKERVGASLRELFLTSWRASVNSFSGHVISVTRLARDVLCFFRLLGLRQLTSPAPRGLSMACVARSNKRAASSLFSITPLSYELLLSNLRASIFVLV